MTRFCTHIFLHSILVAAIFSFDLQMTGEFSFGFEVSKKMSKRRTEDKKAKRGENVTAAPLLECPYQYPESEQLNAIMSNMMNELTNVFVKLRKLMLKHRRSINPATRFRVVERKDTSFFDDIYADMKNNMTSFYNNTALQENRAAEDPCDNQEKLKEVWRRVLEGSLDSLRGASQQCIDEFLQLHNRSEDQHFRSKLQQFLMRKMPKVRISQLDFLCDHFQLCYDELL